MTHDARFEGPIEAWPSVPAYVLKLEVERLNTQIAELGEEIIKLKKIRNRRYSQKTK